MKLGDPRHGPGAARPLPAGHGETYSLTLREPGGGRALWVSKSRRAYAHRPGVAFAETCAIAFDREDGPVVVKDVLPMDSARFDRRELSASIDESVLSADTARGSVATGDRVVRWDLRLERVSPPAMLLPSRWLYTDALELPKVETPAPDVRARGTAEAQAETWNVFGWRGAVVRRWGTEEPPLFAWGHVSSWDEDLDLLVEGMTTPVVPTSAFAPPVTAVWIRAFGSRYAMNGAVRLFANVGEVTPRRWKFRAEGSGAKIRGELWAETDDFVGIFAEGPRADVRFRLLAPLARARVEVDLPGRPTLVAHSRAAALEIATRDPHHGVRMYV